MKNQKGVTLVSLIIYILALTIVISTLSIVSNNFFNNMKYVDNKGKYISEFNKFNMYFLKDVKQNTNILQISNNNKEIIFNDGTKYTFTNDSIYRNKVKICKNIADCSFEKYTDTSSGIEKNIVKVIVNIEGLEDTDNPEDSVKLNTSVKYVLKYW